MNSHLKKELEKNRFTIVKHGFFYIMISIFIVLGSLCLIKIEGQSIILMVIDYYIR